jgi:hypothetical protein
MLLEKDQTMIGCFKSIMSKRMKGLSVPIVAVNSAFTQPRGISLFARIHDTKPNLHPEETYLLISFLKSNL